MQRRYVLNSLIAVIALLACWCDGRLTGGRLDGVTKGSTIVFRGMIPVSSNVEIAVQDDKGDGNEVHQCVCVHSAIVSATLMREIRLKHKIQRSQLIDLTANNFQEDAIQAVCSYIKDNLSLKTLVIDGNVLDVPAMRSIVQAVRRHPQLNYLSLSSCNLNDEHTKPLAYLLRSNTNITNMDVSANKITHEGLETLLHSEGSLPQIEFLDLSYNKIDNEGVAILSKLLKTNKLPNLVRLELKQVGADVSAFTELFSSIPAFSPLRYIDISGNSLFGNARDGAPKYYSGAQAAKHLQGLLPTSMTDALASAVDAVNSQWLYSGNDGDDTLQTRKKIRKSGDNCNSIGIRGRKAPLPTRRRRNTDVSRTTSARKGTNIHTRSTNKFAATKATNTKRKLAKALVKQSPHRAFINALIKFASNNQWSNAKAKSDMYTMFELVDAPDRIDTAVVYVGLAKTGLDEPFARELQRICASTITVNTTELHPENASETNGDRSEHRMRLSLGCELNGLSVPLLAMIDNVVGTIHRRRRKLMM